MQQMLKQVQKMQADMLAAQEALKDELVEASAGGGMVTVQVTGDLVVKSIKIDPEAVDPDDVELLQDMVLAAVNEGCARRRSWRRRRWAAIAGGLTGRPRRSRASGPVDRLVRASGPAADHRALEAAGSRRAHRAAARLPPAARQRRGGARAR